MRMWCDVLCARECRSRIFDGRKSDRNEISVVRRAMLCLNDKELMMVIVHCAYCVCVAIERVTRM